MTNLFEHFEDNLPRNRQGVFLESAAVSYTFGELMDASARYAHALARLGVTPGDRVLVPVEKSADAVLLYLACLRTGAIYVPLNTAYTVSEMAYFLDDASPTLVVVEPTRRFEVKHSHVLTLFDDDGLAGRSEAESNEFDTATREDDDIAAILYTSGTTGRSKGAMLSHSNLSSNAFTLLKAWDWQRERDVLIHALPIYHVHGLFVGFHCALLGGSRMIFLESFHVDTVLEAFQRATVFMGVPTYYTRLLADSRFTRERCSGMRLFISGSAPLRDETFREFEKRVGQPILERYGMTEAGMITSNPIAGPRQAGAVGPPLADVEARVRGE
ncbi:MAG: AMP-binding protein, partial [Pseudomonadales bacterium]